MSGIQPPKDVWMHCWHQLQAPSGVVERMEWLDHEAAIASRRVHANQPHKGGYWVRASVPLTAQAMQAAGWRYLRPCEETTPLVSWERAS